MPVYEQTYQHYYGQLNPRSQTWMVITSMGIRQLWKEKMLKPIFYFSLLPVLLWTGRIYISANADLLEWLQIPSQVIAEVFTVDEEFFYNFLKVQQFFVFLLTLRTGSDIIASDRRHKALILYLSKPLSKVDYLFGKAMILMFYLYLITLIPAWLMMFLNALFTENWSYLIENIPLALQIFLFSHILIVPLVFIILGLSASTKSWATSAALLAVVYFLPPLIVEILNGIFRSTFGSLFNFDYWRSLLTLHSIWEKLGATIFHQATDIELSWFWHLMMLVLICGFFSWLLHRKIQAVEVVS
ncbi:MAG: hypothetical protein ACOX5R_05230 [bacterium]